MNRFFLISIHLVFIFIFSIIPGNSQPDGIKNNSNVLGNYKFPEYYRGIYLNVWSSKNTDKLNSFIIRAKKANINCFVMDVQAPRSAQCAVPPANVEYCKLNGIHAVARVVVFSDGLKQYPVSEELLQNRLSVAESACKNGFKEIQFDYIRFSDGKISKRLTLDEKYEFIQTFLNRARQQMKKYNVKIATDVFGRIPLNNNDAIGQKMEVFDSVVDVICPMAYPSHYTWSEKMMADPYYTVFITSKRAKERVKNAEIVTYIQAFKMKLGKSKLSYEDYIMEQLKACQDSGIRGFIMWNASQEYDVPLNVAGSYYNKMETRNKEKPDTSS